MSKRRNRKTLSSTSPLPSTPTQDSKGEEMPPPQATASTSQLKTEEKSGSLQVDFTAVQSKQTSSAICFGKDRCHGLIQLVPIEVLAKCFEYLDTLPGPTLYPTLRLVSWQWKLAVGCLLEPVLSSQIQNGVWTLAFGGTLAIRTTKHLLCSLEHMSSTLLGTVSTIQSVDSMYDWNRIVELLRRGFEAAWQAHLSEEAPPSSGPHGPLQILLPASWSLTDEGAKELAKFSGTTRLNLSRCNGLRDIRPVISRMKNLQVLDLSKCGSLRDESLEGIAQLPMLTQLMLKECPRLTSRGVRYLGTLTELRSLDLSSCFAITDDGVESLASLPKLEVLSLAKCHAVSDAGLRPVVNACPLLTLALDSCHRVSNAAMIDLATKALLRCLSSTCCHRVSDAGVIALAKGCPELTSLEVSDCGLITDDSLIELANLPKLQKLAVTSRKDGFTDRGLHALTKAPSLQALELSQSQMSVASLRKLADIPTLTDFYIGGCRFDEVGALDKIQRQLRSEGRSLTLRNW